MKETWKRSGNASKGKKERTKIDVNIRCDKKYRNNCDMGNTMMP
jgi:hypothetical protein